MVAVDGSSLAVSGELTAAYNRRMADNNHILVTCPDCGAEIVTDRQTGKVLLHKSAKQPLAGGKTLEGLMDEMEAGKERAEDIFAQEVAAHEDRERILADRFEEALKRAEEEEGDEPPRRPFDLD